MMMMIMMMIVIISSISQVGAVESVHIKGVPSCFKIFVGKHKSFYADDVETMALNQSHNLSISEFFKFINVGKSI